MEEEPRRAAATLGTHDQEFGASQAGRAGLDHNQNSPPTDLSGKHETDSKVPLYVVGCEIYK